MVDVFIELKLFNVNLKSKSVQSMAYIINLVKPKSDWEVTKTLMPATLFSFCHYFLGSNSEIEMHIKIWKDEKPIPKNSN